VKCDSTYPSLSPHVRNLINFLSWVNSRGPDKLGMAGSRSILYFIGAIDDLHRLDLPRALWQSDI
jgi:hypothetical protein